MHVNRIPYHCIVTLHWTCPMQLPCSRRRRPWRPVDRTRRPAARGRGLGSRHLVVPPQANRCRYPDSRSTWENVSRPFPPAGTRWWRRGYDAMAAGGSLWSRATVAKTMLRMTRPARQGATAQCPSSPPCRERVKVSAGLPSPTCGQCAEPLARRVIEELS